MTLTATITKSEETALLISRDMNLQDYIKMGLIKIKKGKVEYSAFSSEIEMVIEKIIGRKLN